MLLRGTRGVRRTAGDGNLRRNLKERLHILSRGITSAPLAIRATARSRVATLAQREAALYNLVAFVCPFKLPALNYRARVRHVR